MRIPSERMKELLEITLANMTTPELHENLIECESGWIDRAIREEIKRRGGRDYATF